MSYVSRKVKASMPSRKEPVVPDSLKAFVHDTPEFILNTPMRGKKSIAIALLAQAIKAMSPTQCQVYTMAEFDKLYGPYSHTKSLFTYIKTQLKEKYSLYKVRVVEIDGRVYISKGAEV